VTRRGERYQGVKRPRGQWKKKKTTEGGGENRFEEAEKGGVEGPMTRNGTQGANNKGGNVREREEKKLEEKDCCCWAPHP